jgi:hypothetical protein
MAPAGWRGIATRSGGVAVLVGLSGLLAGWLVVHGHAPLYLAVGAIAMVVALTLQPHLLVAASLAVLVTFQLSAERPFVVGSIAFYTSDLLLVLVAVRAFVSRPRRKVSWTILDTTAVAALLVWALVIIAAAARGYLAGAPAPSAVRLGEQVFYYPMLAWGFVRVLRERGVSSTQVGRALAVTALASVGYMAFERLTHQRFENPDSAAGHLGSVVTAQGITLHRDYGFYSAYDLYGLGALAAIAYLLFGRRSSGATVALAGLLIGATALSLVRGIVFGLIAGVVLLGVLVFRSAFGNLLPSSRVLPLAVLVAAAVAMFWAISPTSARGTAERFLPGIAPQAPAAVQTARYRQQALSFAYREANAHPLGSGFVSADPTAQRQPEAGFLAHSAWATMLVYTGWLGLLAFLAAVLLLVRRSAQVPDGPGWLKPFFAAAVALLLVEGFGSDSIVGQPWVLGEAALVIGIRFGLADLDD